MTMAKRRGDLRPQVRELLAALRVGDRLPSERELSDSWNVARMTVRRALDEFLMEGVIERRHGSGTFVAPRPFVKALGLTSFSEDMKERGLVPGSRLISLATIEADSQVAKQLRIAVGTPVYRFTRLRLGSGEPLAVETVWIRTSLVPGSANTIWVVRYIRLWQIAIASWSPVQRSVFSPRCRTCEYGNCWKLVPSKAVS